MEVEMKAIDSCGSNLWTLDMRSGFMVSKLRGLGKSLSLSEVVSLSVKGWFKDTLRFCKN